MCDRIGPPVFVVLRGTFGLGGLLVLSMQRSGYLRNFRRFTAFQ
ncbi:MAG: hypothetical protein ACK56I_11030 [bacterium]